MIIGLDMEGDYNKGYGFKFTSTHIPSTETPSRKEISQISRMCGPQFGRIAQRANIANLLFAHVFPVLFVILSASVAEECLGS